MFNQKGETGETVVTEKCTLSASALGYIKTTNTTKNKFHNVFAKKGRYKKADVTTQNAEYTPTVSTLVNIVKRNIKNKPWSALYSRVTRGSQLCTRVPTCTCQSQPLPPLQGEPPSWRRTRLSSRQGPQRTT